MEADLQLVVQTSLLQSQTLVRQSLERHDFSSLAKRRRGRGLVITSRTFSFQWHVQLTEETQTGTSLKQPRTLVRVPARDQIKVDHDQRVS